MERNPQTGDTVQTLARQNLALSRHQQSVIDNSNSDSFLALLQYMAKLTMS